MNAIQILLLQLKQNYIAELPDRFHRLEELVLQIEREGYTPEIYNDLFRQVHSLKGSGGTHGLQIITRICHPFEDYLSTINEKSNLRQLGFGNISFSYLDLLSEVGGRLANGEEVFTDVEDILNQLRLRSFAPRYAALIVENSNVVIKILTKTLISRNFRVVTQDDGYAALGRALVEPFDLIISATEIKQLNGIAFLTALKLSNDINSHTKTILLTSNRSQITAKYQPDFTISKDDRLSVNLNIALVSIVAEFERNCSKSF
jgi:chemotaxis protein histidine kinase CheA